MSSRSKQRSKERKGGAVVEAPVPTTEELRPQLLGFSFYLLGTGCLAMGLGQLLWFALMHQVAIPSLLVGWALPLGQIMGVLGLLLAWRMTEGRERRLMLVGVLLWIGLFALAIERLPVQRAVMKTSVMAGVLVTEVAPWAGSAIVLSMASYVVYGAARKVGGRTWPTLLGLTFLVAHAFELAWPAVVPSRRPGASLFVQRNSQVGAVGLLLLAFGLFAIGKRLLPDEGSTKGAPRKIVLVGPAERPSLFADAVVALAGITFALCASVALSGPLGSSSPETAELAGTGGFALVALLLWLALRAEPEHAGRPARFALGALASSSLYLVALYVASRNGTAVARGFADGMLALPALLAAAALYATATAQTGRDPRVRVERDARRRVTAASVGLSLMAIVLGLFLGEGDLALAAAGVATLVAAFGIVRSLSIR